jgi:hypothetical protein
MQKFIYIPVILGFGLLLCACNMSKHYWEQELHKDCNCTVQY